MADFIIAGTAPYSFTVDSVVTGVVEDGATPQVINLAPNINLVVSATKTLAEIADAMQLYLRPRGYLNQSGGGVKPSTYDGQVAPALTELAAA